MTLFYLTLFIPIKTPYVDLAWSDHKGEHYTVLIIDFDLATQADTYENAVIATQKILNRHIERMRRKGESLPKPSTIEEAEEYVKKWCEENRIQLPENCSWESFPV